MNAECERLLTTWPHPVITGAALAPVLGDGDRRHSAIKRLLQKGALKRLKRGVYEIGRPYRQASAHPFALAPMLYGPSYVSLESALSYHGWTPEAVYTITSVCPKRYKDFDTPEGLFRFERTPGTRFFAEVERVDDAGDIFYIAHPWKAIADWMYVRRCSWPNAEALCQQLRIEPEVLEESDVEVLKQLADFYPSKRVRAALCALHQAWL